MKANLITLLSITLLLLCMFSTSQAQTTVFTYQGKLADNGNLANDKYDFQFKLFDTPTVGTGTQQGSTLSVTTVQVTNGLFSVQLDFGACPTCFNGANRYLEISVKQINNSTYTTLSPRQQITSTPYALKSVNATTADGLSLACVNCVTSSQIQSVNGSQITGTIPIASIPAGSTNYIQNTASMQENSNFNISGNGTVGNILSATIVSAISHYSINGIRILSTGGVTNIFAGVNAGLLYTDGTGNAFFGSQAGQNNTSGNDNAFFGRAAGLSNSFGSRNAFFGSFAGQNTTAGNSNAFFGASAGAGNSTGTDNAFFGESAGFNSTTANNNSFFGAFSGYQNTTGNLNSFFGFDAGANTTTGSSNAFFGSYAGLINSTGHHNAFFGTDSGHNTTTGVYNAFFGTEAGYSNTSGGFNAFFGTNAGNDNTSGSHNAFFGFQAGISNTGGNGNAFFGDSAGYSNTDGFSNSFFGWNAGSTIGSGFANVFIGVDAGLQDTGGVRNTFIGGRTGFNNTNTNGHDNTLLGFGSDVAANLSNATAIGASAFVTQSDSLVLGNNVNVGIGTPAPIEKLQVVGDIRVGTTGANGCLKSFNGGTITGVCSSDARFKRDITPFPNLLSRIVQLQPVHFYWRADQFPERHFGQAQEAGLIAQEVEKILPELVSEDKQGYKAVNYSKLPLLTLQAVKELKAENDSLKQRLNEQQKQVEALKRLACKSNPDEEMCQP